MGYFLDKLCAFGVYALMCIFTYCSCMLLVIVTGVLGYPKVAIVLLSLYVSLFNTFLLYKWIGRG